MRRTTDRLFLFVLQCPSRKKLESGELGEKLKATHLQAHGLLHEAFHETANAFALPRSQQDCVRCNFLASERKEHTNKR